MTTHPAGNRRDGTEPGTVETATGTNPRTLAVQFGIVAVLALLIYAIINASGWLVHPLGSCTGSAQLMARCKGYNFWSGIGSDLGEVTLITAVVAAYWHHTCHVTRCWRFGRFAHGHLKLCAHHHPLVPNNGRVTKAEIDAVTRSVAAGDS
jgi:hypothetical protein